MWSDVNCLGHTCHKVPAILCIWCQWSCTNHEFSARTSHFPLNRESFVPRKFPAIRYGAVYQWQWKLEYMYVKSCMLTHYRTTASNKQRCFISKGKTAISPPHLQPPFTLVHWINAVHINCDKSKQQYTVGYAIVREFSMWFWSLKGCV